MAQTPFTLLQSQPQPPLPSIHSENDVQEADLVEKLSGNVQEIPLRFVLPVEHRFPSLPLSASSHKDIPVIDLSGLIGDQSRVETLLQIHQACAQWGFFQVINHGVPQVVLQRMHEEAEEFLSLPIHERAPDGVKKGVEGQGYGSRYVKPNTGAMDWRDFFLLRPFPESLRDDTAWPKSAAFREAILTFCNEMKKLSETLLATFSENLGLRPSYIQDAIGELHQIFLINYYHPCPQPDIAIGANQHSDLGAMTCLWQTEDVVGLQVLKDGEWVNVRPIPDAIVINVADQLEILSNGIYKSVQHRAVVNTSKRRISIAAFHDLHPDAIIYPAPELVDADHPALYPPTRFGEHARKIGIKVHKKIEEDIVAAVT